MRWRNGMSLEKRCALTKRWNFTPPMEMKSQNSSTGSKTLKWTITMKEYNLWKKLLKEKRNDGTLSDKKYIIVPEQESDKEVASQLETLLNHHLAEEEAEC